MAVSMLQYLVKVALIQKVLIHLSFPQTDEPYYFPELEFCDFKGLRSCLK